MSVLKQELRVYGSATMPDDDTTLNVGGAIDTTKKVDFNDISPSGNIQIVSSAAGDTTQSVTVSGRDASGALISEVKSLNGTTAVVMTANTVWERLLKAIKSATTTGDVAVEEVTPERTGTAQAGSSVDITLDTGASAVDDVYTGMVVRITGGTGIGQIRQVIAYTGSSKVAAVSRSWGTNPDATSVFRVSQGMVFDKAPSEITQVRRPFYNAVTPSSGSKTYFEKIYFKNENATLALTTAVIAEIADPSGKIDFALETTLSGVGTNGAGNSRLIAPSGGVGSFDSATKNVANSQNHSAGAGQGVWLKLSLTSGDSATKTTYTLSESGQSI